MNNYRIIESDFKRQTKSTWAPLHSLILLFGTLTGCGLPGPSASDEEVQKMERAFHPIEASEPYQLSYLRAGDEKGWRIIFVHGTPGSAAGWRDYLLDVPEGFEFIAVDRPGFGESGPDAAVKSLKDQAAALAHLLQDRDGRKTVLVGHSLGGPIVTQVALDYPDQIAGIMIAAGSLDPSLEEIHFMQHIGDSWPIRPLLPRAIRNSNHELLDLEAELERQSAQLDQVKVPVKIIHGTNDDLVPFSNVEFMKSQMINADLDITVLTDRNHFIPWHSKEDMDMALHRLLKTIDPSHNFEER